MTAKRARLHRSRKREEEERYLSFMECALNWREQKTLDSGFLLPGRGVPQVNCYPVLVRLSGVAMVRRLSMATLRELKTGGWGTLIHLDHRLSSQARTAGASSDVCWHGCSLSLSKPVQRRRRFVLLAHR
jgi:hypothetical protein